MFVETMELDAHGVNNRWGEIGGGTKGMEQVVSFFNGRNEIGKIKLEPVFAP